MRIGERDRVSVSPWRGPWKKGEGREGDEMVLGLTKKSCDGDDGVHPVLLDEPTHAEEDDSGTVSRARDEDRA